MPIIEFNIVGWNLDLLSYLSLIKTTKAKLFRPLYVTLFKTLPLKPKHIAFLRRIFLILSLTVAALFIPEDVYSDHNAGGELTWECKSNGKFVFTLKLYRFCEGIPLGASANVSSNSPVTSMSLTRTIQQDISPKCYDSTLWMDCNGTNSAFTIEELIYVSADITINGVPPATGWDFYWSSCWACLPPARRRCH